MYSTELLQGPPAASKISGSNLSLDVDVVC